jgi:hypothetical protein
MAVCVVLGVALFGVCLQWYRAVRRRCVHAEAAIREQARWDAYEWVWGLCAWGAALGFCGLLLAGAYGTLTHANETAFEHLAQYPVALFLASVLLAVKARFAPWAVCLTGQWWLGSYALTGDVSFQTPLRALFESFTDFLPEPFRWAWGIATLILVTFSWVRVFGAKTDLAEIVA